MNNNKSAIGDRVEFVKADSYSEKHLVGKVGTVVKEFGDFVLLVAFESYPYNTWWCLKNQLERL